MPIFICRQCGNLTETEQTEKIFCSVCGAPLLESQDESKPETPPSETSKVEDASPKVSAGSPTPQEPDMKQAPEIQLPPSPQESAEPKIEITEEPASATALSVAPERVAPRQTPVPLGVSEIPPSSPTYSSESISPNTPDQQSPPSNTTPIVEVYENKNLVVCPECSYGCNPVWDKCPICGTPIASSANLQKITEVDFEFDQDSLKKQLIPCPNCQYACDPSWTTCPICQTKLSDRTPPPSSE
ncbi:MAG: hypothetical protein ACTSQI_12050 [Candidatus Helarchaeota archaeon]